MTAPRAASTSSASCSDDRLRRGGRSTGTPATAIPETVVRMPEGKICTGSPIGTVPDEMRPADAR